MDGEFVDWDDATIHILNPSLHYGWGVFEGIRAYATDRGPAVFRLTEHIQRLFRSAHIYMMKPEFNVEQIVEATKELVRRNEVDSCYIRPLFYLATARWASTRCRAAPQRRSPAGPGVPTSVTRPPRTAVRAAVSSWTRSATTSIPPAGKATGQYINSSLAKVAALKAGYDEAIILTPEGTVSEGSGENIFVVYGTQDRHAAARRRGAGRHHP